mgnify:CR=1 FL=1
MTRRVSPGAENGGGRPRRARATARAARRVARHTRARDASNAFASIDPAVGWRRAAVERARVDEERSRDDRSRDARDARRIARGEAEGRDDRSYARIRNPWRGSPRNRRMRT